MTALECSQGGEGGEQRVEEVVCVIITEGNDELSDSI